METVKLLMIWFVPIIMWHFLTYGISQKGWFLSLVFYGIPIFCWSLIGFVYFILMYK